MNRFIAIPIALITVVLLTSATYATSNTDTPVQNTRVTRSAPPSTNRHDGHVASAEAVQKAVETSEANARTWWANVAKAEAEKAEAARKAEEAHQAAHKAEAARRAAQPKVRSAAPVSGGLVRGAGTCGGSLPPCYIMTRESKGYINIYNGGFPYQTTNSSASGKWQFVRGTWGNYGGYPNAADAPESVQDAKARQLWANGAGCSHWSAC